MTAIKISKYNHFIFSMPDSLRMAKEPLAGRVRLLSFQNKSFSKRKSVHQTD